MLTYCKATKGHFTGKSVKKVYTAHKGQIYMSSSRAGEQGDIGSYCYVTRFYFAIVYTFFKWLLLVFHSTTCVHLKYVWINVLSVYLKIQSYLECFFPLQIALYFSMTAIWPLTVSLYFILHTVDAWNSFTLNQKQA